MTIQNPVTNDEWQKAVDAAHFWLMLDDARLYGLINFKTMVNRGRCLQIIQQGQKRGIFPRIKTKQDAAKK